MEDFESDPHNPLISSPAVTPFQLYEFSFQGRDKRSLLFGNFLLLFMFYLTRISKVNPIYIFSISPQLEFSFASPEVTRSPLNQDFLAQLLGKTAARWR